MKKKQIKKIDLKKFSIAKITSKSMQRLQGGDCIPTEVGHTDWVCPTSQIP
ncbi:TIGR04149 family rSAM-modified RiPP [Spongiimicrobium salis]|uniref:TIGR04149 family rSAM-modified RiPP n=1 Tax=Spongiimicrobium salis TaxID=1667022 RepID=UPI00374DA2E5